MFALYSETAHLWFVELGRNVLLLTIKYELN